MTLGRYTYGAEGITVLTWGEGSSLSIGSFCSIAPNVTVFLGGNHRTEWVSTFPFAGDGDLRHMARPASKDSPHEGMPYSNGDVTIGNDVWLGRGVTIMSGVTVGDGAAIAANAHVVKDVAPYEIVGGNPGRVIRKRFAPDVIKLLLRLAWWELPDETLKTLVPMLSAKPSVATLKRLLREYRHTSSKRK